MLAPLATAVSPSYARIEHKIRKMLNYYTKLHPSTDGLKKCVVFM